jgi:hypothetical protein
MPRERPRSDLFLSVGNKRSRAERGEASISAAATVAKPPEGDDMADGELMTGGLRLAAMGLDGGL